MNVRRVILVSILALLVACAPKHAYVPPRPQIWFLPFTIPPDDLVCVQQFSGNCSRIKIGELRKLLASMGKA